MILGQTVIDLPISEGADTPRRADIRVANSLDDFAAIWPTVAPDESIACYVFACAEIVQVWLRTIGAARGTEPYFFSVYVDDTPLLLLAVGIERRHGLRVLTFLDGGVTDYNGPVLFRDSPAVGHHGMAAIWQAVLSLLPTVDLIALEKIADTVSDCHNPMLLLGLSPYRSNGYFFRIRGDWKSFADKLSTKQDSRRQLRKLAELGAVRTFVAEDEQERQALLAAMIRQKTRRYLETRGTDSFDRPGYRSYFTELTNTLGAARIVQLSGLTVGGEIIATHWGLVARSHYYFLMPTYESGKWNRYSAGRLLMEYLFQWAFENGCRVFDFGFGDESYKLKYCDERVGLFQLRQPLTLKGRLYEGIFQAAEAVKRGPIGPWAKALLSRARGTVSRRPAG